MNREDYGRRFADAIGKTTHEQPGDEWFTVKELAELTGYSTSHIQKLLNRMLGAGLVERVAVRRDTRGARVFYYRLIEPSASLAIPRSGTFSEFEIPTTLGFVEM